MTYRNGTAATEKYIEPQSGREIVFLPVTHVAPLEFYDNVKAYVDSLRCEGYVVFNEGVLLAPSRYDSLITAFPDKSIAAIAEEFPPTDEDMSELDTLQRKFRKILGFSINGAYDGGDNKSNPLYSVISSDKYISQNSDMLWRTEADITADLSIYRLITAVEERYGEIELNDYDFEIDLDQKYRPRGKNRTFTSKQRKEINNYVAQELRNDYIIYLVKTSPHDKIAVVYGRQHVYGISGRLKRAGWYEVFIQHKYYDYSGRDNKKRFTKRVAEIESAYMNGLAKAKARREAQEAGTANDDETAWVE